MVKKGRIFFFKSSDYVTNQVPKKILKKNRRKKIIKKKAKKKLLQRHKWNIWIKEKG